MMKSLTLVMKRTAKHSVFDLSVNWPFALFSITSTEQAEKGNQRSPCHIVEDHEYENHPIIIRQHMKTFGAMLKLAS